MDGRTAVCHNKPVFWRSYKNEWPISWNYEYIIFGQIIFQNFHQFKTFVGLSDCRTIGPSDYRTVGLSDCRIIATAPIVLHARLRNKCSSLNSDLFKSNLVPSASCSCGYKNECSEHFLLYCNKFNLLRNNMLIELNMLDMRGLPVNIDILLFGNDDLSVVINTVYIFMCTKIHKRYMAFLLN